MSGRAVLAACAAAALLAGAGVAAMRMGAAREVDRRLRALPVETAAPAELEPDNVACAIDGKGDGSATVTVTGLLRNGSSKNWHGVTAAVVVQDGSGAKLAGGVAVVGELEAGRSAPFRSTPVTLSPGQVSRAARVRATIEGLPGR